MAKVIIELGRGLIDEAATDDSVKSKYTESYTDRAPRIIDILQRKLAGQEDITLLSSKESRDDMIEISEGLEASFVLVDKKTNWHRAYNRAYSCMYRSLICTMCMEDIAEKYDVLRGWS